MPPLTEAEKERRRRERQMQQQAEVPAAKSPVTPGEALKPREQTEFQKAMAMPREAEMRAGVTVKPAAPPTPGFVDIGAKIGRAISPEAREFRGQERQAFVSGTQPARELQPFTGQRAPAVTQQAVTQPAVEPTARQRISPITQPTALAPGPATAPATVPAPAQITARQPRVMSAEETGPIWMQGNLTAIPRLGKVFSAATGEELTGRTVTKGPSGTAETLTFGGRTEQQPGALTEAQRIRANVLQEQQSSLIKAAGEALEPEQREALLKRADDAGAKLEQIISPPTPTPVRGEEVVAPVPQQEQRAAVTVTPEDRSRLTEIGEAFRKGDTSIAKKYFGQETPESIRLFKSLPFQQRQFILENR